jgi:mRNA-degrading endonuclease RelE of RelBE toxin-antitoxin system
VKPLAGTSHPKLYRLRVGGYRAIFWVNEERREVLVEKIAPRRRAYLRI